MSGIDSFGRMEQEPDKGEEALRRIGLVKSHGEVTQQNLNHFVGLGFWARLKWLLFGPKRLLKTYPISDDAGNWGRGGLE